MGHGPRSPPHTWYRDKLLARLFASWLPVWQPFQQLSQQDPALPVNHSEYSSVMQLHESQPTDASDDRARRKQRKDIWKGKGAVIDQVNELIDELDDIANNIALQARVLLAHRIPDWPGVDQAVLCPACCLAGCAHGELGRKGTASGGVFPCPLCNIPASDSAKLC